MHRLFAPGFFAILVAAQAPDTTPAESLSARLEASVETSGSLRATFTLTASGAVSLPYRDAYIASPAGNPRSLFGTFMLNKLMLSTPVVKDADDPAHPINVHFPIYEDYYVLPVQRQAALQFALVPPLPDFKESGGELQLGTPGVRREEVTFQVPLGFEVKAESHTEERRAFGRYQSDTIVELGKLVIVRELDLKTATASSTSRSEVEQFWRLVRADQQRTFLFKRVARSDPTEWLASVPINRAQSLAYRAIEQREYDAARQLLERVTQGRPNDRSAWNNLGRAFSGMGKLDEAQKAYERQIAINPSDQYAFNNLALVFERQGKWTQAIEALQKQLQVHPGDRYAVNNLPRALVHEHRWSEVEGAAENASKAQPASALFKVYASVARICGGKVTDIRSELDATLGPRPSSGSLNNAAYYLSECDKQGDLAEKYIRRALDQVRGVVNSSTNRTMGNALAVQNTVSIYLDTYGWLAYKQGNYDHSVELLSASAALSPRGEVYGHLAHAQEKAGHPDQALLAWRQATFLEPGQMPQLSAEVTAKLESIPALSLDREWYSLKMDLPETAAKEVRPDRPSYFFANADPEGRIQSIRELDSGDQVSRKLLPALSEISFPKVQADGIPVATVHIVRIAKGADGQLIVARSVGAEAVAIAGDLSPAEFPLPPPATPSPPPLQSSNGAALRIGGDVTPPRILSKVEPFYSQQARRAHVEGAVRLQCIIGSEGIPRDFRVLESLGYGLDENAILAVSAWRFAPAMKAGEPVSVFSTIEVRFHLLDKK
jgi:TonB family protein